MSTCAVTLFLLSFCGFFLACGEVEKINITISGAATGDGLELAVAGARRFMQEHPKIQVHVAPTPASWAGRQAFYELLSERRSPKVDVYQIDVIWPGMFADHAVDLREHSAPETIARHFPSIIANNTVDGKLVAMPLYTDAPFLFYRTDLLAKYGYDKPPATWDELEDMATRIAEGEREDGNLSFWGYVWQGRPYEGLTCNAVEWQGSHGGGSFIGEDGKPQLANQKTIEAFQRAARWVDKISPSEVTEMQEEESRLFFQKGDAAFLRNWPNEAVPIQRDEVVGDKFAVAPLPAGPAGRTSTLGGWNLMVSSYSQHPKEAVRLVEFLTGEAEQKIRAIEGAFMPTIESLYEDSDVQEAVPFIEEFRRIHQTVAARPSALTGSKYQDLSKVYWDAVSDILNGADAADRLSQAEEELAQVLAE